MHAIRWLHCHQRCLPAVRRSLKGRLCTSWAARGTRRGHCSLLPLYQAYTQTEHSQQSLPRIVPSSTRPGSAASVCRSGVARVSKFCTPTAQSASMFGKPAGIIEADDREPLDLLTQETSERAAAAFAVWVLANALVAFGRVWRKSLNISQSRWITLCLFARREKDVQRELCKLDAALSSEWLLSFAARPQIARYARLCRNSGCVDQPHVEGSCV